MSLIKPGTKTSEFSMTVIVGGFSALVALGVIDPQLIEFGATALESINEASASGNPIQASIDSIYKLVALVTTGWVATSYNKSRAIAKSGNGREYAETSEGNG